MVAGSLMTGRSRAGATLVLALSGLIPAACGEPRVESDACANGACAPVCEDGSAECHGERAALCVRGRWLEQVCDSACREGRCVECVDGARRCADTIRYEVCENGAWRDRPCDFDTACVDGVCRCSPGLLRCVGTRRQSCKPDGAWTEAPCPAEQPYCMGEGACASCVPGTQSCIDGASSECDENGQLIRTECPYGCDEASGLCTLPCAPDTYRCKDRRTVQRCAPDGSEFADDHTCSASSICDEGECFDTCLLAERQLAPHGCEFFAPPIYTWLQPELCTCDPVIACGFATDPDTRLHLINPDSELTAHVTVRDWNNPPTTHTRSVPPGQSDWVAIHDATGTTDESRRTPNGAVRVTSDVPIYVVEHYNVSDRCENARSGDTDFLLPSHLLQAYGTRYRAITQPHCTTHEGTRRQPGGFTLVSTQDDNPTAVTVAFSGGTAAGSGIDANMVGSTRTITLAAREAIHFLTTEPGSCSMPTTADWLSGSLVESNWPVALFNGGLNRVPFITPAESGDPGVRHTQVQLQEQIMPVGLWGNLHALKARSIGKEQWIAVTDEPSNVLTFTPPLDGSTTRTLATAGERLGMPGSPGNGGDPWLVESTKPLLIARYFWANQSRGSSFALERPVRFWRSSYLMQAVSTGGTHRILAIVPQGETLFLDDEALPRPYFPGPPGYETIDRVVFEGLHSLRASRPFGVLAYGHSTSGGAVQSYSYTGPVGFGDAYSPR